MVDRITPTTIDQDVINFAEEYGIHDPAFLCMKDFQWVIEDKFSSEDKI